MSDIGDTLVFTTPLDPRAQPLLEALIVEYDTRYAERFDQGGARVEINRYPAERFSPPLGNFLLLLRDGETIGGGAFMPHADPYTAEFKRIWTHHALRRQGLARRVLGALEAQARRQGYRRVYLTTGFRQPEAAGLYLTSGYTALFDRSVDPEVLLKLPFEKWLVAGDTATTPARSDNAASPA